MQKQALSLTSLSIIWVCCSAATAQDKQPVSGSRHNNGSLSRALKVLADMRSGKLPPIKFAYKPIELEGLVIDAWAYLSSESAAPGSPEADKRNICYAIADKNGKVYVAAKGRVIYRGCQDELAPLLGKKVRVKGLISDRGGNSILKIVEVRQLQN